MNDTTLAGVTAPPPPQSAEPLTLQDAIERLRAYGLETFCIDVEVWHFNKTQIEVKFRVWNGQRHADARTLELAVALCCRKTGALADAQTAAVQAAQLQEPALAKGATP